MDANRFKTALSLLESVDRPLMKSKKFNAFLLVEISWKVLIAVGIWQGLSDVVLLAMVGGATATEAAFQGGMAWHDKNVKSEKLRAMNGSAAVLCESPPEEEVK